MLRQLGSSWKEEENLYLIHSFFSSFVLRYLGISVEEKSFVLLKKLLGLVLEQQSAKRLFVK